MGNGEGKGLRGETATDGGFLSHKTLIASFPREDYISSVVGKDGTGIRHGEYGRRKSLSYEKREP